MTTQRDDPGVRARTQSAACGGASGVPPRPPLGARGVFLQVRAPAPALSGSPLRTADHPATSWWSALLRGGDEAGAGAGGVQVRERRAGRGWR